MIEKILDFEEKLKTDSGMIIMDAKNFYSIKHELDEVQGLILENKYLQSKYPNKKRELELGLKSLKQLEEEMFKALKS